MDKSGGNPSKSTKKDQRMDKITRKTSFGQWFSPINLQLFEEKVKTMKLDYYTKKLTTESFLKLLLFAQLQEIESLHALSDCLFDDNFKKESTLILSVFLSCHAD